jgi:diguanylate cyclase (GGDEF)-like protein
MIEDRKSNPPKASDHETFRQSIADLDRGLRSSWRTTIAEIVTLLAIIGTRFLPGKAFSNERLDVIFFVYALLVSILLSRSYELVRHGRTKLILAKQLEIAVRQRVQTDKLYGLSILDPLTGLHNRRFGEERLNEEIVRSQRTGDPLAVVVFDLDYFKVINDKFGHAVGDLALKEFSRRVRRAVRACDIPVRIGGDEFLVILPECPRDKVDFILLRIGIPEIESNGERIPIGYSAGRAHYQYGDTPATLLVRADEELYAQKTARSRSINPPTATDALPGKQAAKSHLRDKHAVRLAEAN